MSGMGTRLPPAPKSIPYIGHALGFARDPLSFLARCAHECGDIVRLDFPWLPTYLLCKPEYIDCVLRIHHKSFVKDKLTHSSGALFGNGLLLSEGKFWKRQRQLTQPAFHQKGIEGYAENIVSHAGRWIDGLKDGQIVDLPLQMSSITMDIMADVLFGPDVPAEAKSTIIGAFDVFSEHFRGVGGAWLRLPEQIPTRQNRRFRHARDRLNRCIFGIIARRREGSSNGGDMLSVLLDARDEAGAGMTDGELRDELVDLVLAGHETTALALSYAWRLLNDNPLVQEALWNEISSVVGRRRVGIDDVEALRLAEATVTESMRLYPPAWAIGREAVEPCRIGCYDVSPGTQVIISPWVTHRDGRFFDRPDEFRPQRWLSDLAKTLPRGAFIPFGAGPRTCIGSTFAMMTSVLLLTTIAQRVSFSFEPGQRLTLAPAITLRPTSGMRARVALRRDEQTAPLATYA